MSELTRAPLWSNDFDMDLLKVIPGVEEMLSDSARITLFTHGHTSFGRLNHPSVWNSQLGMIAYFGFVHPSKPVSFYTTEPVVECTFLEALRDCWSHNYAILVEERLIWDSQPLWPKFETLMYRIRGWGSINPIPTETIVRDVLNSIECAKVRLLALKHELGR